jgi:hypothetical protein
MYCLDDGDVGCAEPVDVAWRPRDTQMTAHLLFRNRDAKLHALYPRRRDFNEKRVPNSFLGPQDSRRRLVVSLNDSLSF